MNRSHLVLAPAAALAGLLLGRALPRAAPTSAPVPSALSVPLAVAPAECKEERAQLASTKAQLAICMAYRQPEPAAPEPSAPTDRPSQGFAGFAAWAQARKPSERLENYPEAVFVRKPDGTQVIYRPDEHSAEIGRAHV